MAKARMTKTEAEDFLAAEMQLLDDGMLEEWTKLFTPEAVYWFPREPGSSRERENAVIYDEELQRVVRARQNVREGHPSQTPRSETVHFCSNIQVASTDREDEVLVRCNVLVYEMRPVTTHGLEIMRGVPREFPARCEYRLRSGASWKIAEKKVLLLQRNTPIYNLSFPI
jgi:3-phenylpropionate/cinnamic acid dioxygenase small subunit